jgi:hypothetical protein
MPLFTTTLTSAAVPGASTACALNWRSGRPATISVLTNSSVGVGDFTINYSLDDLMLTASSLVAWSGISSASFVTPPTTGAAAIHFTSSTIWPDGVLISLLPAVAAVRLNSTALSSNTLTLKVLQPEGG